MTELEVCWYEDDQFRAFVPLASPKWLKEHHLIVTYVAGVAHRLDAVQRPDFAPGQLVRIVPEPNHQHDPNALAIWNHSQTLHAGYVPRYISEDLGQSTNRVALTIHEQIRSGARVGIGIVISRDEPVLIEVSFAPDKIAERVRKLPRDYYAGLEEDRHDPVEQMLAMSEWLSKKPQRRKK